MASKNDQYVKHCHHDDGNKHSCAYVERVNKQIPIAMRAADDRMLEYISEHGRPDSPVEAGDIWSRYYHEEMNAVCESEGIRRGVKHPPVTLH